MRKPESEFGLKDFVDHLTEEGKKLLLNTDNAGNMSLKNTKKGEKIIPECTTDKDGNIIFTFGKRKAEKSVIAIVSSTQEKLFLSFLENVNRPNGHNIFYKIEYVLSNQEQKPEIEDLLNPSNDGDEDFSDRDGEY